MGSTHLFTEDLSSILLIVLFETKLLTRLKQEKHILKSLWKVLDKHLQVLNHAYTKKDHNQVKVWNKLANITQFSSMKTSSITPSEKHTFSSPRSKVALGF